MTTRLVMGVAGQQTMFPPGTIDNQQLPLGAQIDCSTGHDAPCGSEGYVAAKC